MGHEPPRLRQKPVMWPPSWNRAGKRHAAALDGPMTESEAQVTSLVLV
jgi:hypothetical protein